MSEDRTWVRVLDLIHRDDVRTAGAIRLIDAGLVPYERRSDGQVWVPEAELIEAHRLHGARLKTAESGRLRAARAGGQRPRTVMGLNADEGPAAETGPS